MADKIALKDQYQYAANSNLVLQANRSELPRRENEPTGEPESLAGRIDPRIMGDRAQRSSNKTTAKLPRLTDVIADAVITSNSKMKTKPSKVHNLLPREHDEDILMATDDLNTFRYVPQTLETREAYNLLLDFITRKLSFLQSPDILKETADEVLFVLKDKQVKDFDKQTSLKSHLHSDITSEELNQLINLAKKLTDYDAAITAQSELQEGGNSSYLIQTAGRDGTLAVDDTGVAVVFEDDDEDLNAEVDDLNDVDVDDDDLADDVNDVADMEEENVMKVQDEIEHASSGGQAGITAGVSTDSIVQTSSRVESKRAASHQTKSDPNVLGLRDIDAFWIQRQLSAFNPDPLVAQNLAEETLHILESCPDNRVENKLFELLGFENYTDVIRRFTVNRLKIVWCTKLSRATTDAQRAAIKEEMLQLGGATGRILAELDAERSQKAVRSGGIRRDDEKFADARHAKLQTKQEDKSAVSQDVQKVPKALLDLDELSFAQGGHLLSNRKVELPKNVKRRNEKSWEEIIVPPHTPSSKQVNEVPILSLPDWSHSAFPNMKSLNRVQSVLYPAAFKSDQNILLCAPTGAGKTNVALLTILRQISHFRRQDGSFERDGFKIVYIAPMKALVQEMVANFSRRLESFGINVAELTGDSQLTKGQIVDTQIIVTTPEKWDVITRKSHDRSYTNLVRLIIIDEIHLLHDDRGPVLEAIISRTKRQVEQTRDPVRLVGLSATLPNYTDVAIFLGVDLKTGLFFFDGSYRPCPLQQTYIGVKEKKALKRFQVMNDLTFSKVMEQAGKNQVLVFVHSRKETVATARALVESAIEKETISSFFAPGSSSPDILKSQADLITNDNAPLANLLRYGFAVHHAGMNRGERTLVEDLFAEGHVQVLVSTATLAWGVNLPAHTVIIKGTQIYSPEKGTWVELSPQDVLQMLGRAGRPQYDTFGEGIIITGHQELQFYLSLLNQQLPIESQLMSRLADHLNAEIVLGTIRNLSEATDWLASTYLFIRMMREPALYGVPLDQRSDTDRTLEQRRLDLIHSAAMLLDKSSLIKYDKRNGQFLTTELGRIASHYYITHRSMATYNTLLKPSVDNIELFRIFSLSEEFKYVPVREEEKLELAKLLERVPVPVKETVDQPIAKVNVLLQTYISQLQLNGFALIADMVYVSQSASRILRAIFEICLKQGWSNAARRTLNLCKMVDRRIWLCSSPLRQFPKDIPLTAIKFLERKTIPWERYYDLSVQEIGELVRSSKISTKIHKCIHQIPRLDVTAQVMPITRSLVKWEVVLTTDFEFAACHGNAELFWVLVEDTDNEVIIYHEPFILKKQFAGEVHTLSFTTPLFEPLHPYYFVSVVSDRWFHSEVKCAVSFKNLILPEKFSAPSDLLDLPPLALDVFPIDSYADIFKTRGYTEFNPIQTQVFNTCFHQNDNVFIGASVGSGKTVCAEFAILRLWAEAIRAKKTAKRCVYIAPFEDIVQDRLKSWKACFGKFCPGGVDSIVSLTGETSADLEALKRGHLVLSTPGNWDVLSRRWRTRKNVQDIGLFIVDDLHMVGSPDPVGSSIEVVVSRMRYISSQRPKESPIRIVALAASIADFKDIAEWIGAPAHASFNFRPNVRPVPLEIFFQSFNIPHVPSLMLAMNKPIYAALKKHCVSSPESSVGKSAIVFVPSRKQARLTAADILLSLEYENDENSLSSFLAVPEAALAPFVARVSDEKLKPLLSRGVAYYHETMSRNDQKIVEKLFSEGAIQVVVASRDTCWSIPSSMRSYAVVVAGTQYYDGREHKYVDYSLAEILQMFGMASRPLVDKNGCCVMMCQSRKKEFYMKFLNEALPVESHLHHFLQDHFNAEIVTKTIENKQDAVDYLTWTLLYRRLTKNPKYYGLDGATSQHLSDHLSELVEENLAALQAAECIEIDEDEMDVRPLNLGMIAAYYNIHCTTVEVFGKSLKAKTGLKGIMEVLCAATEFEDIPVRYHEEQSMEMIYRQVPIKLTKPNENGVYPMPAFNRPNIKASILLQAHFSRLALPPDWEADQRKFILPRIPSLLQAMVDVISSKTWFVPALSSMSLCQMTIQAMWDRDSPLKQLPHFTAERIQKANAMNVRNIEDLMNLEDEQREGLLEGLDMAEVAAAANRFPSISVTFKVATDETLDEANTEDAMDEDEDELKNHRVTVPAGKTVHVSVQLERDEDEEDEVAQGSVGPVCAPFFPVPKDEGWWLVIGDPKTNALYAIKRITFGQRKVSHKLTFPAPAFTADDKTTVDVRTLSLFVKCDSYFDADLDYPVQVDVLPALPEDDEDEDEEEDVSMKE